jgi:hypothetical protein
MSAFLRQPLSRSRWLSTSRLKERLPSSRSVLVYRAPDLGYALAIDVTSCPAAYSRRSIGVRPRQAAADFVMSRLPMTPLADSLPVAFRDHDARDFIDHWARAEAAPA